MVGVPRPKRTFLIEETECRRHRGMREGTKFSGMRTKGNTKERHEMSGTQDENFESQPRTFELYPMGDTELFIQCFSNKMSSMIRCVF